MSVTMINENIEDGRLDSFPNLYFAVPIDRSRWRQHGWTPVIVMITAVMEYSMVLSVKIQQDM